ncbi:hypothetical protein MKW92_049835 [Papaver armeniacum]|nr:hypothetical protein MKW92_049835 [Papaver armeniacum]
MVSRSSHVWLFLFAILALSSAHVERVSAANWYCAAGELERVLPEICATCLKCTDWCASQGRPLVTKDDQCVDQKSGTAIWHYCVCCCGGSPPSPPPPPPPPSTPPPYPPPPTPSPPPPSQSPPPPPRDPRDLCDLSELSLSSATAACPVCPVCNCPGGITPEIDACVYDYCSCCCLQRSGPSPPAPPPPRDPRDLCDPSEVSLSSATTACPICPVCNCGPGVTPAYDVCVDDYCSCCCLPSTLSLSTRTTSGSFLFAAVK